MFRALPCSYSGGLRRNCIYAASGIVTIPEAAYIRLRRRPPEDEQGNARNMYRILINVLYVNKYKFCASSWRSNNVILRCTVNQSSGCVDIVWRAKVQNSLKEFWQTKKLSRMWVKIPAELKTERLLTPKRRQYILRSDCITCMLYVVSWFFVTCKLCDIKKNYTIQNFIILLREVFLHTSSYRQFIPSKEVFIVSLTLRPLRERVIRSQVSARGIWCKVAN